MKKTTFIYLIALCAGSLMICSYASGTAGANIDGTGAETGLSNSAGCGQGCHASATTIAITVELDSAGIPTTRYMGGMTYTVKITGKNTGTASLPKFGFQIGAIQGANAVNTPLNAGTWTAPFPVNTNYVAPKAGQFVVGIVEQTAAIAATTGTGGNGTTYVQTLNWVAPVGGTGTISFWGVINAVNGNGSETGDKYNTAHIVINEIISAPLLTVTTSAGNVKCFGGKDGSATAIASGTPPYTYSWNTTPTQTTSTATNLSAGTYTVTVHDAKGSKTATVTVTSPPLLACNTITTNPSSCSANDGSITSSISGGTPPYKYLWDNGSTSASISGLSSGTYTLTVTDANGCNQAAINTINWSGSIPIGPSNPLMEGFENSFTLPAGWNINNPDNDASWEITTTVANTGTNAIGFNNCSGNGNGADMTGTKDRFITCSYDFTKATTTTILSFDLAYAVLDYKNQIHADSLAIFSSSDCGSTWDQIYLKGGTELSNILTSVSCWTPAASDWKNESIGLGNLAGKPNVMFAFENRSNWGEWIYIDNINIVAVTGIESFNSLKEFTIYPNPASTTFTIKGETRAEKIHYIISTTVGSNVKTGDIETSGGVVNEQVWLDHLSKGMYFITFSDRKNTWTQKLNIQ